MPDLQIHQWWRRNREQALSLHAERGSRMQRHHRRRFWCSLSPAENLASWATQLPSSLKDCCPDQKWTGAWAAQDGGPAHPGQAPPYLVQKKQPKDPQLWRCDGQNSPRTLWRFRHQRARASLPRSLFLPTPQAPTSQKVSTCQIHESLLLHDRAPKHSQPDIGCVSPLPQHSETS